MKTAYRALSIFLIVWIILSQIISIALPKHEYIASTLADEPESWTIDASEVNRLERYSKEALKEEVVKFLNENQTPTYTRQGYLSLAALICLFFTVAGWIREGIVERKSQSSQEKQDPIE